MTSSEPNPAPDTGRDPGPDSGPDPAMGRFAMLQLVRLGGLAFVIGALLILGEVVSGPQVLGYGMLVIGLFEFFYLPMFLARRWKTPSE